MKKNIAIIDTETAGGFDNPMVYDIGCVIIDQKGNMVAEYHSLVKEVWESNLMETAYYSNKIPCYDSMILDDLDINYWDDIRNEFSNLFDIHSVGIVSAYNLRFDMGAIRNTNNQLGQNTKFLTKKVDLLDLWLWACSAIMNKRTYHNYADTHGFTTPAGNYKTSAETAYAFLANIPNFVESHTALDDCYIEAEIAKTLLKRKGKKPLNELHGCPWRIAQPA